MTVISDEQEIKLETYNFGIKKVFKIKDKNNKHLGDVIRSSIWSYNGFSIVENNSSIIAKVNPSNSGKGSANINDSNNHLLAKIEINYLEKELTNGKLEVVVNNLNSESLFSIIVDYYQIRGAKSFYNFILSNKNENIGEIKMSSFAYEIKLRSKRDMRLVIASFIHLIFWNSP